MIRSSYWCSTREIYFLFVARSRVVSRAAITLPSVVTCLPDLYNNCMINTIMVSCRVISRAPGLKLVVQTLLSSLRPIGNIVLICCTFFIIFGILGVQVCSVTAAASSSSSTVYLFFIRMCIKLAAACLLILI